LRIDDVTLPYRVYVFLFVTNKRLNRSGPNFVCDLTWSQRMFMDAKNNKTLCPKPFEFCMIFKISEKIRLNLQIFAFNCTKRRSSQIDP